MSDDTKTSKVRASHLKKKPPPENFGKRFPRDGKGRGGFENQNFARMTKTFLGKAEGR